MKLLKLILPFLLSTLIANTTLATISYEGKESREISYYARKLFGKTTLSDKDVARRLLAFPSSNKMIVMEKYKIPKGIKISRGKVAPLDGHPGGAVKSL
jgi:hypothetical protein